MTRKWKLFWIIQIIYRNMPYHGAFKKTENMMMSHDSSLKLQFNGNFHTRLTKAEPRIFNNISVEDVVKLSVHFYDDISAVKDMGLGSRRWDERTVLDIKNNSITSIPPNFRNICDNQKWELTPRNDRLNVEGFQSLVNGRVHVIIGAVETSMLVHFVM